MQMIAYIAVFFLVVPLLIIVINNLFPTQLAEKTGLYLAGFAAIFQMAASVADFFLLSANKLHEYSFSLLWNVTDIGAERFAVNAFSLIILFCIGLTAFVSVLVANQTIEKKKTSYVSLLMALILGMNGMVIVTDLFSLYVFLEIVGVASFVMIAMFKSKKGLEGAFKYLVMSALASILILTGIAFIFMYSGSLQYANVGMSLLNGANASQPILIFLAFILMIAGFAIKTGAVPFHGMIPDAYESADTSVTLLLSGIVIKVAGLYGMIILVRMFDAVPAINTTLSILGAVTIVVGALYAFRQNHFKRMVAYSSISQAGYIILAISTGSVLGLLGAVLHIFNHATAKCTLFANAAAIHKQTGTYDLREMGGLQQKMPVTGFSSISAFLSTAGIPPFAGFWSKLLIVIALWTSGLEVYAGIAVLASILTAAYLLRMQKQVFFGKLPEQYESVEEIHGSIKFAEFMLTFITIFVGVAFPFVLIYLKGRGII